MDRVPTTAGIDVQYKQCIPKFPEKLDWGDTEDYVAIGMRRKPVMPAALTGLPDAQRTFVMLSEAFGVDPYEARIQLFPEFLRKKCTWVKQVTCYLLDIKKLSLDDFLEDFLKPEMPLDEIGIFLFARMMHKHFVVCFNDLHWTSRSDDDNSKADVTLIYRGKCLYMLTVPMPHEEYLQKKEYLESVRLACIKEREKSGKSSSLVNCTMQDDESCTMQDGQVKEDSDESSCTVPEQKNCTVSDINDCTVLENVIGSAIVEKQEMLDDIQEAFNLDLTVTKPKGKPKNKPKPKPSRRSKRIKNQKDDLKKKVSQLNFRPSSKQRTTVNSMKTSKEVAAANLIGKSRRQVGLWNYTRHGLKKPKKLEEKRCKCPACTEQCDTYKLLVQHIKVKHPEYKYKCKYCAKTFTSNSWRYQHQMRHEGLCYIWPEPKCKKLFQFYYQVQDHWKKHSKHKLYTCETRDCHKGFTTKSALMYHKKVHDMDLEIKEYACDFVVNKEGHLCGKTFARKALMEQHKRSHSKSYKTHCGLTKNWPNSRKYHQDRCDACKAIVAKKKKEFKY